MTTLSNFSSYGEELERRLQLKTFPLAIKLLEKEKDIPEGAIRPKRDLGFHLGLCQAFAMSRREGKMMAMLKEDNWCYLPVIAFGQAEPPDKFLQGKMFYKFSVGELNTAKDLAAAFPRLEYGKYIGVVSAPLRTANFQHDLVVMYCNPNQLRCLLSAIKYKDGSLVASSLDPSGACIQCTVPALQTGDCQVTVPCGGDRKNALALDDEMIFTVPGSKLDDLMSGLRHFDKVGFGYTHYAPNMRPEYPLFDLYVRAGKMVGLDMHK